jgi:CopG family transcriptional regulator, nickel-responsive regulator
MSDLVRFGVAMDRALLTEFDRRIAAQGYENRSEAIRDLVRRDLTRAAWERGSMVTATLTVVYTPDVRSVVMRLCEPEPAGRELVVASLHVRIDAQRCLDAMVLRGLSADLAALAGRIAGTKGVLACELTLAAPISEESKVPRPAEVNTPHEQEQG